MTNQKTRWCLAGQLMREMEVSNLPGRIISAVQCCSMQHNQYQLIVSSQTHGQLTCLRVDDAVASQAVLADTLAAMQVQTAGQSCISCRLLIGPTLQKRSQLCCQLKLTLPCFLG